MKQLLISTGLLLIQLAAIAQNDFIQQSFQLPFSNEIKSYYVKKQGTDYILNGDIIAGNTLQKTMLYQTNNHDRYIWPKGEIAIQIDESLTNRMNRKGMNMRKQALEAIGIFNRLTNLRLVARTNQPDYITIKFSPDTTYGGLSPVGRVGGEQVVWITALSAVETYLHELMHSFGFYHEQSRHDRDLYVVVDTTKAIPDFRYSFQIEPGVTGTAYDYMSVMHYGPDAFAMKAGDITIRCKNGNKISDCNLGGFRLSDLDIAGINSSYFYNASLPRVEYKDYLIRKEEQQVKFKNQPSSGAVTKMADQQLEEGMYKIKVNQTGKYLAIEGISKDNGARLVQWDYVDQANHKFYVKKIADGIYVISAVHSGRYINAAGQGTADGTPVIQWDYAAQDNVRWRLYYITANQGASPGWVIQNKNSGTNLCLPSFGGTNNGEALVIRRQAYNDGAPEANQTFSFEKIGNLVLREQGLYENSPGMLKKVKQ